MNGERIDLTVTGPMHTPVKAHYGYLKDSNTAVMEMASAAGITLVPDDDARILFLLPATVWQGNDKPCPPRGCRNFIIGIGGRHQRRRHRYVQKALGVRFLDENDVDAGEGGQALAKVSRIDISGRRSAFKKLSYSGGMRCEQPSLQWWFHICFTVIKGMTESEKAIGIEDGTAAPNHFSSGNGLLQYPWCRCCRRA